VKPLRLRLLAGELAVWRLAPDAPVPPPPAGAPLWSATRTADELSVVSAPESAPPEAVVERGWRSLVVLGPLSFSTTGVLASLSAALASAGVSIFVVSTFDTDYLLVKEAQLQRAVESLRRAGHEVDDTSGAR